MESYETADVPALSVIIPAYNEAARIVPTLDRMMRFLSNRPAPFEIIVVDDGSTDGTAALVDQRSGPTLRVLRLGSNRGKGAALRAGVAVARGARVLLTDADMATPIEEVDRLAAALASGAGVAIGSRAVAAASITRAQSFLRRWLGRAGNAWIRLFAVEGVADTQCGFKLLDGPLARRIFARCREDGFGIDVEVLCLAQRAFGTRIEEVGVAWEHRDGSKVRGRDYPAMLSRVARIGLTVGRAQPAARPPDPRRATPRMR